MFFIADAPAQFSISRETGLITVDPNNPLDYETNTTYSFTVEITDMGNPPLTVSITYFYTGITFEMLLLN